VVLFQQSRKSSARQPGKPRNSKFIGANIVNPAPTRTIIHRWKSWIQE